MCSDVEHYRLMIVIFTSNFFTNWVEKHVTSGNNSTFNPYLSFLFYCLWVPLVLIFCSKPV